MLLRLRADLYPKHPRAKDVLLAIEVADTTLVYDLDVKMPLYARVGIPEAWVVDLAAEQVRVHREPAAGVYARIRTASRGDSIDLLHFPHVTVSVDDILGSS